MTSREVWGLHTSSFSSFAPCLDLGSFLAASFAFFLGSSEGTGIAIFVGSGMVSELAGDDERKLYDCSLRVPDARRVDCNAVTGVTFVTVTLQQHCLESQLDQFLTFMSLLVRHSRRFPTMSWTCLPF